MATQNAIDSDNPIEVSIGGTGNATLTDHGVLVGSGTAAITPLAVGGTGTLLVGTVGTDPAFATSATGNFTFTSSTASQTRVLTVSNTDNTGAATSAARLDITTGGANVDDPQIKYLVTGETTFSIGVDNDDVDKFKIAANAALGISDIFISTLNGEITKPLQPAFLSILATGDYYFNVTGNGTIYSYICDTEIFDQNSDFNTGTGQFTAPVTGRYYLLAGVRLFSAPIGNEGAVYINTSNRRYSDGENRVSLGHDFEMICTTMADMDLGDVAFPQAVCRGEVADTAGVFGLSDPALTCFAGFLAC